MAVVMKHAVGLTRQGSDDHVGTTVVVIVLKYSSHAGKSSAVRIQPCTRLEAHFCECAVAIIVKQVLLHTIVGNKDVSEAVPIVIRKRDAQSTPFLTRDPGTGAHVVERAVPAI